MSAELVLYTHPMSRGRTARWILEEIGQPYRAELLDFAAMQSATYLAINPMGKVPALRHGEVIVTETAAICAYLADTFLQAGLAPAVNDPLRGAYYRWLFFAAGPLEQAATDRMLGVNVPTDREAAVGYGNLDRVLDTLELRLSHTDYIVGPDFTAADLYVGAQLSALMHFEVIERREIFTAYENRIMERPAAVRAKHIDDVLLAEQTIPSKK